MLNTNILYNKNKQILKELFEQYGIQMETRSSNRQRCLWFGLPGHVKHWRNNRRKADRNGRFGPSKCTKRIRKCSRRGQHFATAQT